MRMLLLAAAAAVTLAAPASAQVFLGADDGGAGVQVGPVGVGVGPRFDGRYHDRYYGDHYYGHAYNAGECRTIKSRTVTPSGRVVYRTKRICD